MVKLEYIKQSYKDKFYVVFGKFILNRDRLNRENVLLVKYPKSHAPVPKIRRTVITDDFKNLINDLLDTEIINTDLQKDLSNNEQDLFLQLLTLAGIKEQLNYKKVEKSISDYKKRFEVLRGSLLAGNDNIDVKTELIEIIDLLSNKTVNAISESDARELKKELT